ncbi:uncharacterized protein LOC114075310 [Solanum pennellii]|uniref:Uncharacterized protein LOC114075310 n=1 Tax=Solanum pennellii TaxID=28526 RepID=A0ABM1V1H9_SOLPN|nr:uncharacterized protein LOC114075310 [Solanum pennellii]
MVCEPIFKLLMKDAPTKWTEECQTAFDAIKNNFSNPPILVPPREGSPLLLYLYVSDSAFGCVLGQHNETAKKKRAIYYISKKFTPWESRYTLLERTCCALTWLAQKLRHYLSSYTTYPIYRIDPLKYIFQKAMPIGKLAKWKMLLMSFVGEDTSEAYPAWILFFDGAANQGTGIEAVLVSESGQHYPMAAMLRFYCTNNMAEYEACILGLKMDIEMNVHELLVIGDRDLLIHQVQGEWDVKNPKIIPYVQHVQKLWKRFYTDYIDSLDIELKEHPVHCSHVEEEPDGLPWYFDIKKYLVSGTYPEDATSNQKKSIRRMVLNFFLSGEFLYRKTPDLGLLRCVDAVEAARLI